MSRGINPEGKSRQKHGCDKIYTIHRFCAYILSPEFLYSDFLDSWLQTLLIPRQSVLILE